MEFQEERRIARKHHNCFTLALEEFKVFVDDLIDFQTNKSRNYGYNYNIIIDETEAAKKYSLEIFNHHIDISMELAIDNELEQRPGYYTKVIFSLSEVENDPLLVLFINLDYKNIYCLIDGEASIKKAEVIEYAVSETVMSLISNKLVETIS